MTVKQKYYAKSLIVIAVFVASLVTIGLLGFGKFLGPGGYSIGAAFLPAVIVAFVLWPKVWAPVELSSSQLRTHQIVGVTIYVVVFAAQVALANYITSSPP
jgi:hypothetical protein